MIWVNTLYVCLIRIDDEIHSDHSYLEGLEKPLCSALIPNLTRYWEVINVLHETMRNKGSNESDVPFDEAQ